MAVAIKQPLLGALAFVLAPAIGTVLTVAMAVGAFRFQRLPERTNGRTWAIATVGLLLGATVAMGYATLLATRMAGFAVEPLTATFGSFVDPKGFPWATAAAHGLVLLSLVAMLSSLEDVSGSIGEHEVERRARRAVAFVGVATVVVAAVHALEGRGVRSDVVVLAGIGALLVTLVAVARALGVVRYLEAYERSIALPRDAEVGLSMAAWRDA